MPTFLNTIELTDEMQDLLAKSQKLCGLTQKELAELADVHQGWISRTLSGKRHRLKTAMVRRLANTLADTLDEKGPEFHQQAAFLRAVFIDQTMTEEPMTAVRGMAGACLAKLGLNGTTLERLLDDPCLKTRAEGAIKVFRAVGAMLDAIPDCLDDRAIWEAVIAGIASCGLGISTEIAAELCEDDTKGKLEEAIATLDGVIAIISVALG